MERRLIEPRLTGARLSALVQAALVYTVLVYTEWILLTHSARFLPPLFPSLRPCLVTFLPHLFPSSTLPSFLHSRSHPPSHHRFLTPSPCSLPPISLFPCLPPCLPASRRPIHNSMCIVSVCVCVCVRACVCVCVCLASCIEYCVAPSRLAMRGSETIRLIHVFSRVRQPLHCPETNNC